MKLQNRNILLISPEAWGDHFVSKHHYARTLAGCGNQVYFLNPPGSKWDQVSDNQNLVIVDYRPTFRGLGRMPGFLSAILTRFEVNRIERFVGVKFDVIWNFDSSRFFNLSQVGAYKICHLVDLNQNIQRPLLAATSDVCFGTTRYILAELTKHNSNSHLIGHAYQPAEKTYDDFDFSMPGENKIKALYVGNLSMKYIDWEILAEAARSQPTIDFIFVGPEGRSNLTTEDSQKEMRAKLRALPNCFFPGSVHSRYIPQLLQLADVLLIAYQERYHKDQAAPHKMVEYLASGKPIFATYTKEFDDERYFGQLRMVRRNQDFIALFRNIGVPSEKVDVATYLDRIREIELFFEQ